MFWGGKGYGSLNCQHLREYSTLIRFSSRLEGLPLLAIIPAGIASAPLPDFALRPYVLPTTDVTV